LFGTDLFKLEMCRGHRHPSTWR